MKTKIFQNIKKNKGMTYVELIVVLGIFAVLSSVAIFNYGAFQANVDIKNLASDIALKIVEAQKSSLNGLLPPLTNQPVDLSIWKPSYGVYFDNTSDGKSFIYFADLDQSGDFDLSDCPGTGECLDKITITKNDVISRLDVFSQGVESNGNGLGDLSVAFKRPDSSAIIKSKTPIDDPTNISFVQITIVSSNGNTSSAIKIYPSGRIEIGAPILPVVFGGGPVAPPIIFQEN